MCVISILLSWMSDGAECRPRNGEMLITFRNLGLLTLVTFSVLELVGHHQNCRKGSLFDYVYYILQPRKNISFFDNFPHPAVNKESENHLTLAAFSFHNCKCKNIYNTTW